MQTIRLACLNFRQNQFQNAALCKRALFNSQKLQYFHSNQNPSQTRLFSSLLRAQTRHTSTRYSLQNLWSSYRESVLNTRWYRGRNELLAQRSSRSSRDGIPHFSYRREPPWKSWLDRLPGEYILWGILGLNGLVYLGWMVAESNVRMGDNTLYIAMWKNVLLSWKNIKEGRIWTMITSTFSHSSASHFFFNALTFYFMAPPVIRALGNTSFLGLYFFGGLACSTVSLLLNQSVRNRDGASNGASGAIYAVISFFTCMAPNTTFLLFFAIPMPAWALVGGIFCWDAFSALSDRRTQVDGAGHVGGIIAGILYYLLKSRGL